MNKRPLVNYFNVTIQILFIALLSLIFSVLIRFSSEEVASILTIITRIVIASIILLILVQSVILLAKEIKKHEAKLSFLPPLTMIFSIPFAGIHLEVFLETEIILFTYLSILYLLVVSLKLISIELKNSDKKTLTLTNIFLSILILCFIAIIAHSLQIYETIEEPKYLFILDIVFLVLKLAMSTFELFLAFKGKNISSLIYNNAYYLGAFITGYFLSISLFHLDHNISKYYLLIPAGIFILLLVTYNVFIYRRIWKKE